MQLFNFLPVLKPRCLDAFRSLGGSFSRLIQDRSFVIQIPPGSKSTDPSRRSKHLLDLPTLTRRPALLRPLKFPSQAMQIRSCSDFASLCVFADTTFCSPTIHRLDLYNSIWLFGDFRVLAVPAAAGPAPYRFPALIWRSSVFFGICDLGRRFFNVSGDRCACGSPDFELAAGVRAA